MRSGSKRSVLIWEVINAGSDGALSAELVASIKRKQPIIAWTWEPYWVPAMYPGEFVKLPEYNNSCYKDASWGVNPDKACDCGRPTGSIWKSAWAGGEAVWHKGYDVLRKMQLNTKTAGDLVHKSDVNGIKPEEVARQWIESQPHGLGPLAAVSKPRPSSLKAWGRALLLCPPRPPSAKTTPTRREETYR